MNHNDIRFDRIFTPLVEGLIKGKYAEQYRANVVENAATFLNQLPAHWCNYTWFYNEIAEKLKTNDTVVEIGTFRGVSIEYLNLKLLSLGKICNIYCIDNYKGVSNYPVNDFSYCKYEALDRLKFYRNISIINFASDKAANLFDDNSIDFIFIDGDHEYENVYKDIISWLPKANNIIAGHDYSSLFPGVMRAVDEVFRDNEGPCPSLSRNLLIRKDIWSAQRSDI